MRLDVRDPSYKCSMGGEVFVDSVRLADCVAFDTEQGWAEVLMRDAKGKLVRNQEGTDIARQRVHGSVRFEPRKKEKP